MIDLYYAATPNGQKLKIFMEETGLEHNLQHVNLSESEQFQPEFLAISANNKIPALVDHEPTDGGAPISLFESGAMLLYLADKEKKFLPTDFRARNEALQWLFWQVAGLGPMAGQAGHFRVFAKKSVAYGIDRYTTEVTRLYGVMDTRLAKNDYLAGEYSIADMACFPWIIPFAGHGQNLADFPNLSRWFQAIAERPAILRAYAGVADGYAKNAGAKQTK